MRPEGVTKAENAAESKAAGKQAAVVNLNLPRRINSYKQFSVIRFVAGLQSTTFTRLVLANIENFSGGIFDITKNAILKIYHCYHNTEI
ncbi:hypothetical protein Zmor_021995 [Zophobas morio]|uniref:Uncharacterized protein n=1 Tax=Zophobas morio TaxID=2755281 RepID=A0AA38I7B3_9CUCU|nr:hypothetical protein Zmor_021995 [Zophobas morio]